MTHATPKGVVAVLTGPDGEVYSSLSDFHTSRSAGYTVREAQEHRLKQAIARDVVDRCCAACIAKTFDRVDYARVLDKMLSDGGFTLTMIPVGHEENAP